jgi:hypothetical protein
MLGIAAFGCVESEFRAGQTMDNTVLQKNRVKMRQKPVISLNHLPAMLEAGSQQGCGAILAYIG